MTTWDVLIAWFYPVDEPLHDLPKHPEVPLWPRAGVPLGLRHALTGVGNRAFHRWVTRDSRPLLPRLPEWTRLCRLCTTPQDWTQPFLAAPTGLGGMDTDGMERMHPLRAGRRPQQIGRTGLLHPRWSGGGTRCPLVNQ
jgi:hypothetical protein